jgi:hypothetical protein
MSPPATSSGLRTSAASVQHVGVDHRGAHVFVTQEFLDGANVVARLEEVSREGVPECMTADVLRDTRSAHPFLHGALHEAFVNMMTPLLPRLGVLPTVHLREYPLPTPLRRRAWVFAVQGFGQRHAAPTVGQVPFVSDLHEA